MSSKEKMFEKDLYDIWLNQRFDDNLQTIDGEKISLLDPGVHNSDTSGPDFQNARIRIGNLTFVGDIEIDSDYVDWKSHGHHLNNRYNKVVLHATLTNKHNQPYVYTKDGRKVPSIKLSEFIDENTVEDISKKIKTYNSEHEHTLRCIDENSSVDRKIKEKFVLQLGTDRYKKKCRKMYDRLKELKYLRELRLKEPVVNYEIPEEIRNKNYSHDDFKEKEIWLQLLYENIFEALGYSKNKSIMLKLAQSADIEFLKSLKLNGTDLTKYEAALFGISGLIPEADKIPENHSSEYTKNIFSIWNSIKEDYDGATYNETDWNFFRLRPQNFPTVRIAGGARLLNGLLNKNLVMVLVKKIKEIRNLNVLVNSLRSVFIIQSDGFWQDHYVFDNKASSKIKYFIGVARADEILVNVIFPFFTVYFEVFGKDELAKKVFKLYSIFSQKNDNRIVREVTDCLELQRVSKRTIYSQGMIELFRNYCSRGKCLECEIGKPIFS